MNKRTRLVILIICVVLFSVITPYIVLYSLGYRIDFVNGKIIETGGIYVRVFPQGADITIDSKIKNKTGLFLNSIFVQNLLPKQHAVLIEKEGYHSYQKNLLVKEKEVTKLENVVLFKNKTLFDLLENNVDYFSIAPNNANLIKSNITNKTIDFKTINLNNSQKNNITLPIKNGAILDSKWSDNSNSYLIKTNDGYFLLDFRAPKLQFTKLPILADIGEVYFDPENSNQLFFIKNKNLYSTLQNKELIKNVASFLIKDQKVIWLSSDGFLYIDNLPIQATSTTLKQTEIEGETNKTTEQIFSIKKNSQYKLVAILDMIFLQEDESLYLLDQNLKKFESFYGSVKDLKISPDWKKVVFYNDHEIMYSLTSSINQKILLSKPANVIHELYWLNNDYLIFKSVDEIIISEIDARGNVNTITLPKISLLTEELKNSEFKPEQIFWNEQDKKLYILAENNLLVSENLLP